MKNNIKTDCNNYGWIAKDGSFYPCDNYEHSDKLEELKNDGHNTKGYVHVGTVTDIYINGFGLKPTQAQVNTLGDIACEARGDLKSIIYQFIQNYD